MNNDRFIADRSEDVARLSSEIEHAQRVVDDFDKARNNYTKEKVKEGVAASLARAEFDELVRKLLPEKFEDYKDALDTVTRHNLLRFFQ